MSGPKIAFYTAADLNLLDGSAIWMESVVQVLARHPDAETSVLLRFPEKRRLITDAMRQLDRVRIIDGRRYRRGTAAGLRKGEAIEALERIDRQRHFDIVLLRGFLLAQGAAERGRFDGRLWSSYILEPELDITSPTYLEGLDRICRASARVVVQSNEMRTLLESLVPSARGRTILLPPAIPDGPAKRPPVTPRRRMLYTGKFHPFYAVPTMIDIFTQLRREWPELEFHIAGDKVHRANDPAYAERLERGLLDTPGLTWHGGISRSGVGQLLSEGGVALSVWEKRLGPQMNDLVISTKLLDYCAAGLPVILNRTAAQEALLGRDYPLFLTRLDEVPDLLRRVLDDPRLYEDAADRCWAGSRQFTYSNVAARLADDLNRPRTEPLEAADYDRPKLPGAAFTLGVAVDGGPDVRTQRVLERAVSLLRELRAADSRFRLEVRVGPDSSASTVPVRLEPGLSLATRDMAMPSWLERVGWWIGGHGDGSPSATDLAASGTPSLSPETASADQILDATLSGAWADRSRAGRLQTLARGRSATPAARS